MDETRYDSIVRYLTTGSYPDGANKVAKYTLRRASKNFRVKGPSLYLWYYIDSLKDGTIIERLTIRGKEEAARVFLECHVGAGGGYRGRDSTVNKVRQRYYWPNYYRDCIDKVLLF